MTQDALSWTPSHKIVIKPKRNFYHLPHIKTVLSDMLETVFGTPDWIRTSGLQSRSLSLYPSELRAHIIFCFINLQLHYYTTFPAQSKENFLLHFVKKVDNFAYLL